MSHFQFENSIAEFKNQVDWVGLRYYSEKTHNLIIRNEHPEAAHFNQDQGLMVEVLMDGHLGYAATTDLSSEGIKLAFWKAKALTKTAAAHKAHAFTAAERPASQGTYNSPYLHRFDSASLEKIISSLMAASRAMKASDKVVSRLAEAQIRSTQIQFISSNGSAWEQNFSLVATDFSATAEDSFGSQTRSDNGGMARCYQVGAEAFDLEKITRRCQQIGEEALELLKAPNCPTDRRDLILAPDQMLLQIHESIGHPLELDRILGDERNYAGSSFVKPKDFGHLRYGSSLLNVVFDPTQQGEYASYAFDDIGNPAQKEYLIKDGVLLRGLGSLESQRRLQVPGVANARASSWNRAPIDRMANINIEPGHTPLAKMIGQIEKGILMKSNRSWSIDDYRDKFQFGCEYGQLIEDGRLTTTVKNPNYRGRTLDFWSKLTALSDADTYETYGSNTCAKGEPSQMIRVGHGSPYCLFSDMEVFGGVS